MSLTAWKASPADTCGIPTCDDAGPLEEVEDASIDFRPRAVLMLGLGGSECPFIV